MHTIFDPHSVDWTQILQLQQLEGGYSQRGGYGVFRGLPYQRGAGIGSVFRSLFRFLLPIGREAGVALGQQGIRTGIGILSDALDGKNIKEAAFEHGRQGARKLLSKAASRLESTPSASEQPQGGGGALVAYTSNKKHINRKRSAGVTLLPSVNDNRKSTPSKAKKKRRDALGYY